MLKYRLANGGSIEFTRKSVGYDVRLRDASGSTTATLDMSDESAWDVMRGFDGA